MAKIPGEVWEECRATAERKARTLTYENLSLLLLELALEKESDQHLNAYRPGGGNSGSHGRGYQGPRPSEQGQTPTNARYMRNIQDLFWCDSRDKKGGLLHTRDCDMHQCFVVQGKKQETNTGGKAKMPDHYRCTITSAFHGHRKHYEDECYGKQRLSAKLKSEGPLMGVKTAKVTATRAKASPSAVARAKTKAKEDVVVLTRGTRRTKGNQGETTALRKGGQTLTRLVVGKTLGLRPAPKRKLKLNKKKEPNVPTKTERSLVPASGPA